MAFPWALIRRHVLLNSTSESLAVSSSLTLPSSSPTAIKLFAIIGQRLAIVKSGDDQLTDTAGSAEWDAPSVSFLAHAHAGV
jgi:hypothetical protein